MKNTIIYLCLIILTMTACAERIELESKGDAAMIMSVATRSGTGIKEPDLNSQQLRLYIADRRQELGYDTGIKLYCPDEWRIDLTSADYTLDAMPEQWYKMAFVCIPQNAEFGFEDKYYDFNNQLVDYGEVLKIKKQSSSQDLAVYRKIYDLWLFNGQTKTLNAELERITGQLVVDMGILEDQFEKVVSKVEVLLIDVPDKVYIHDQSSGEIILSNSRLSNCTYEGEIDSEGHYVICANLLPMQLIGCNVKVTFTDATTQEFPLINNATNPSEAIVEIKRNTRTTLFFNGMEKNEFEVRYAGFDDTLIDVSDDQWNGWKDTDDFLVEYAVADAGIFLTRASGDSRIQSLTYLIYESSNGTDYNLLRRREIPDIATATWPLTRETMTWGQREALKDTLSLEKHYKAVFIANASELLSGVNDGSAYSDARLTLPDAITDNNMFYLASQDISGATASHDIPTRCKVMLQRAITRTDIAVAAEPTEEEKTSLVNAVLAGDYIREKYQVAMDALLEKMINVAITHPQEYSDFKTRLERNESGFFNALESSVKHLIETDFENNPLWNCYNATEISVIYSKYANQMDLERTPYTIDSKEITASGTSNSVYSFGTGADDENQHNLIASVKFGDLTLSAGGLCTNQQTNEHYRVTCKPIAVPNPVSYSDNTVSVTLNLWNLFVASKYKTEEFKTALNEALGSSEAYTFNLSYPDVSKQEAWSSNWTIEELTVI